MLVDSGQHRATVANYHAAAAGGRDDTIIESLPREQNYRHLLPGYAGAESPNRRSRSRNLAGVTSTGGAPFIVLLPDHRRAGTFWWRRQISRATKSSATLKPDTLDAFRRRLRVFRQRISVWRRAGSVWTLQQTAGGQYLMPLHPFQANYAGAVKLWQYRKVGLITETMF